tara:strand:- start:46 stop:462 length:417 start_codon:yes stop_codon:yes gene_type:complete
MVKEGNTVKVHYTGKFEDDKVFDTSKEREPISFKVGAGMMIPGFENGVVGLKEGESKTLKITPEEGYGQRNNDLVNEIPLERLPEGVERGALLQAQTEQGPMNVVVSEVKETTAMIDANHPLAGKNLVFDIELVEIVE